MVRGEWQMQCDAFRGEMTNDGGMRHRKCPRLKDCVLAGWTTVLGLIDMPTLPPGPRATISVNCFTASTPKGQHLIKVTADRNNTVIEGKEGNNAEDHYGRFPR